MWICTGKTRRPFADAARIGQTLVGDFERDLPDFVAGKQAAVDLHAGTAADQLARAISD